jgi:hypothetical protein
LNRPNICTSNKKAARRLARGGERPQGNGRETLERDVRQKLKTILTQRQVEATWPAVLEFSLHSKEIDMDNVQLFLRRTDRQQELYRAFSNHDLPVARRDRIAQLLHGYHHWINRAASQQIRPFSD